MNISQRSVCRRAASCWLTVTAAVGSLGALLAPTLRAPTRIDADFGLLLTQACTLALLGCAAWAWLVTTLVSWEAARAPGGRPLAARRAGIPSAYRRFILGTCGVALCAGGVSTPALATPGPVHLVPHATAVPPHQTVRPHLERASDILVRPGDSLWRLAAERLPRDAASTTITHSWQRLYHANAALIGADPDHIEPGQRLAPPRGW